MKKYFSSVLVWIALLAMVWAAEPIVTNVRAAQQRGTKLVEIFYDVSGGTPPIYVSLQVSSNSGTTFVVPAAALSGDLGANVSQGRNKHIVWNAGTDWNNQVSTTMRFRVTASTTPPAPPGFALIPAGPFQMGQTGIAEPVHTVQLSAFYMGKYEVTKEEWDAVRTWGLANGYTDLPMGNGSYASKGANHPVHSISWREMVKWCNARSQMEGFPPCYTVSGATYKTGSSTPVCDWSANGYRLPSEAEWEKAARGGLSAQNFPWGNTITQNQANYYASDSPQNQGYHPTYNDGWFPYSSPIGSFAPNGYGLYDMAGNMWEWCWDWDGTSYYTSSPSTDPRGPATGIYRITRGGSWDDTENSALCSWRRSSQPQNYSSYYGFRLARSHP